MVQIVEATPLEAYRLRVRFDDGAEGIYSVEPDRRGGVFLQLKDPKMFDAVRVNPEFGCVEWPCGVDLCPASMHSELFSTARAA